MRRSPSPSDGTLVEIAVQEGETVEVGTIVAFIDTEAGAAVAEHRHPRPTEAVPESAGPAPVQLRPRRRQLRLRQPPPWPADGPQSAEDRLRTRSTPVVRKIAEEHGVDIQAVAWYGSRRTRDQAGHPRLHRARRGSR